MVHGLLSSCGEWAPERTVSVVVAHGLSSCGMWASEHVSSVVVAHGLSCPAACGILLPRLGIEPAFPALEGRFLTTGPRGKSLEFLNLLFWDFPFYCIAVWVQSGDRNYTVGSTGEV